MLLRSSSAATLSSGRKDVMASRQCSSTSSPRDRRGVVRAKPSCTAKYTAQNGTTRTPDTARRRRTRLASAVGRPAKGNVAYALTRRVTDTLSTIRCMGDRSDASPVRCRTGWMGGLMRDGSTEALAGHGQGHCPRRSLAAGRERPSVASPPPLPRANFDGGPF